MLVTLKWVILWIIWSLTSKALLNLHFDFQVINSQHSVLRYKVKSGNGYLKEKKKDSLSKVQVNMDFYTFMGCLEFPSCKMQWQ